MVYDIAKLPIHTLLKPLSEATAAFCRLDERIARSPVGAGFLERQNFADACASLWIDGELVHLEDLVIHDATRDIRTPHPRTDHRSRRAAYPSAHRCSVG